MQSKKKTIKFISKFIFHSEPIVVHRGTKTENRESFNGVIKRYLQEQVVPCLQDKISKYISNILN